MIFELLALDKWYGVSKNIDIAKGINKIPTSISEGAEQIQREWQQKK